MTLPDMNLAVAAGVCLAWLVSLRLGYRAGLEEGRCRERAWRARQTELRLRRQTAGPPRCGSAPGEQCPARPSGFTSRVLLPG